MNFNKKSKEIFNKISKEIFKEAIIMAIKEDFEELIYDMIDYDYLNPNYLAQFGLTLEDILPFDVSLEYFDSKEETTLRVE